MNGSITFTPSEAIAVILAICAAIVTISAAVGVIAKIFSRMKEPEVAQNARLDTIDRRLDEIDKTISRFREFFTNDDNRFKAIEKSNKVTQTALLAILKYSLNGNDKESLREAEKSLEEYLLNK